MSMITGEVGDATNTGAACGGRRYLVAWRGVLPQKETARALLPLAWPGGKELFPQAAAAADLGGGGLAGFRRAAGGGDVVYVAPKTLSRA